MTTLLQIRTLAKQESDNVGQSFITDAEWDTYIQQSYLELYGLLVTCYGEDYSVQSPSTGFQFITDGVNQFFALPTDFFKLLGVDLQLSASGAWVSLKPFPFAERNMLSTWNSSIPMAGQTIRLYYVPRPVLPVADGDTVDGIGGWWEYIVVDAALKAGAKEETDVRVLMARKQALIDRINSEANNRDAGSPAVVGDVQGRRNRTMKYRLNGNNIWLIGNNYYPYEGDNWDGNNGFGGF